MKEDIVIFHCLGGNGESYWIPWLTQILEEKGHKVWHPTLPNAKNPMLEEWIEKADEIIAQTDKPIILIGHSLGGNLILHLLSESAPWQNRLHHAYLFGAPVYTSPYLANYDTRALDWEEINRHASKLTAIWSRDDDRVPEEHIRIIEENTDAQIRILDGYGHFREEENEILNKLTTH